MVGLSMVMVQVMVWSLMGQSVLSCADHRSECLVWAEQCECYKNVLSMKRQCARTCGHCASHPATYRAYCERELTEKRNIERKLHYEEHRTKGTQGPLNTLATTPPPVSYHQPLGISHLSEPQLSVVNGHKSTIAYEPLPFEPVHHTPSAPIYDHPKQLDPNYHETYPNPPDHHPSPSFSNDGPPEGALIYDWPDAGRPQPISNYQYVDYANDYNPNQRQSVVSHRFRKAPHHPSTPNLHRKRLDVYPYPILDSVDYRYRFTPDTGLEYDSQLEYETYEDRVRENPLRRTRLSRSNVDVAMLTLGSGAVNALNSRNPLNPLNPNPLPQTVCSDSSDQSSSIDCALLASNCLCEFSESFMMKKCAASCGFCGPFKRSNFNKMRCYLRRERNQCQDMSPLCATATLAQICDQHKTIMKNLCPKSCRFCQ